MYLHTINKIPQDDVADEQIATTYIIAKDEEFQDIVVSEKVEKPLDIYSFFYPNMLEPHINHYIKVVRHFLDSVYDYEEPTKVIRDDKHRSEALIFKRDNIIEKPWIYKISSSVRSPFATASLKKCSFLGILANSR